MNIYTTEELQEMFKLTEKQARALMRTEGFPSVKIGRNYRVSEEALTQWLDETKEFPLDYSKC